MGTRSSCLALRTSRSLARRCIDFEPNRRWGLEVRSTVFKESAHHMRKTAAPYLSPAPGTISLSGSRVSCSFLLRRPTSDCGMSTLNGTMSDSAILVSDESVPTISATSDFTIGEVLQSYCIRAV